MATVAAASCATAATCFVQKSVSQKQVSVRGLPVLRAARVTCSAERKVVLAASTLAASASAALPSLAAVENILGGEGTGLPLGLNDNGLTWVLFAGFGLVWGAFSLYSASLPKGDDDTGLGL
eukprot:TRINITY_DN13917_c0_g1_i1.p2 TRINITY_DN13917_c0_g1~~TRINITY_DN13917_c0_g1_i1.p2  ORF type:complete len:122 (+),score=9.19 TRINITY_DN13917_c0_g1_i1:179-544(+)